MMYFLRVFLVSLFVGAFGAGSYKMKEKASTSRDRKGIFAVFSVTLGILAVVLSGGLVLLVRDR